MPAVLVTQEAKIRRMEIQSQFGQIVLEILDPILKDPIHKKGLME
jgi:hypothetical protein